MLFAQRRKDEFKSYKPMSLIYILNKVGPNTDPWVTPQFIVLISEVTFPTLTDCWRHMKLNKNRQRPPHPKGYFSHLQDEYLRKMKEVQALDLYPWDKGKSAQRNEKWKEHFLILTEFPTETWERQRFLQRSRSSQQHSFLLIPTESYWYNACHLHWHLSIMGPIKGLLHWIGQTLSSLQWKKNLWSHLNWNKPIN